MKTLREKAIECLKNIQSYTGGWEDTFAEGYHHGYEAAIELVKKAITDNEFWLFEYKTQALLSKELLKQIELGEE